MKVSSPFKLYPAATGAFLAAAWAVGYMCWRVYVDKTGAIDQSVITAFLIAAYNAFVVHPLVTPTARPRLNKSVRLVEIRPDPVVVSTGAGTVGGFGGGTGSAADIAAGGPGGSAGGSA